MKINILITESKYKPVLIGEDDYQYEFSGAEVYELAIEFGQDFSQFSRSLLWETEHTSLYGILLYGYFMTLSPTLEADYEDSITGDRVQYVLGSRDKNAWRDFDLYLQQWRDYEAESIKKKQQELNEIFKGA